MIIFLNFSQNSSNISSDPPIFQCFFIFFSSSLPPRQRSLSFTSHGVLQDDKVFLPRAAQLLSGVGSARSWWAEVGPSKKAGRAHDSVPSGNPPLLVVTRRNQCINIHKFTQMFRVVRVPWLQGWDSGGAAVDLYSRYPVCAFMCESKWERQTEGRGAVL